MTAALTAGLHRIDADAYHRDPAPAPALSSGLARLMLAQSPLHAWVASPRLNPHFEPVEKAAFDIGRAAHRAALGAGADYAEIPDAMLASNGAASTKEAKAFIADCRDRGVAPLKSDQIAAIEAMRDRLDERLAELGIAFDRALSELTAIGELDGVHCRAMVDNAPDDLRQPLYEFKTTTDANPDAATRAVMTYGYDVQAAHYLDTWHAATGEDRAIRLVFQEKAAPFEVSVLELGAESLALARRKIARARELWRLCLESGHWPGYPAGVHTVELPGFHHDRWLDRESREADHKARTGRDVFDFARRAQAPQPLAGGAP